MDEWIQNANATEFWAEIEAFEVENGLVYDAQFPVPASGAQRTTFKNSSVIRDYFVSDGSAHYYRLPLRQV